MNDDSRVTLDASNQKNLNLWLQMIKDHVTQAKTTGDDGEENFDLFRSPGKAWTAREQKMEEERREAAERLKARQELERLNPGQREAKWAAFTADIEADKKEEDDGAPARKMTFSGKSLKRLQLVAKAVDAEEGDGGNLPAYMRAGMSKEGADDELAGLDELEDDPWDELEEADPPVLPPARLKLAKKLFFAYDFDHSGCIDFEEFFALMKKFDERHL